MFCIFLSSDTSVFRSPVEALFQQAIRTLSNVKQEQNSIDGMSLDLLRASSCVGDHRASLLLVLAHLSCLAANQQLVRSPFPPATISLRC